MTKFTPQKPFIAHRVFLSYGHDEYASLALQLRDDLEARGHEVWFDEKRLHPGQDWEASIDAGIEHTAAAMQHAAVILLLTPHAVRRPDGYCLNEVARALSRGLRIIPLLVVQGTEPPLSICRIQWLDLHECIPISDKQAVYRPCFERLLLALEEGKLDFEGGQQRLLAALQPLEFEADVLHHLAKFIGREWVFVEIHRWLTDPAASRVFWLTGGPGVGKTALSVSISNRLPEVAALHLCHFGHAQKGDPRHVVTSIVYQLSTQLPEYEAALISLDVGRIVADDARTIFDNLVVQPLAKLSAPNRVIVILIDALDEATRDEYNELASFIATEFKKTPPWLRLLITSRPEDAVTGPLRAVQSLSPFILDANTEDNLADLRAYLRRELAPQLLARGDADNIMSQILTRSEGVFLYVEHICDDIRAGRLALERPDEFPQGMAGVYRLYFDRLIWDHSSQPPRPDYDRFRREFRAPLSAILAARQPLPIVMLQRIFGWRDEELRDFTRPLCSLVPVSGEGGHEVVKPCHKSLADWLGDATKAGPYYVSMVEGHRSLATACWQDFQRGPQAMPAYSLAHLPTHLLASARWQELELALTTLSYMEARVTAGQVFDLATDFTRGAAALPPGSPWKENLHLLDKALRRDLHFIHRHRNDYPQALFQCLWNTAWWHDAPDAAMHYECGRPVPSRESCSTSHLRLHRGETDARPGDDSISECPVTLCHLLEHWRSERERCHPHFPWLRMLRPPSVALASNQLSVLRGHEDRVTSVVVTPDGTRLASASHDKTIRFWDTSSGREMASLRGHEDWVNSIALSPDGTRLASASSDKTLRLWNAATGREIAKMLGHEGTIRSVAVSPDGMRLASGSSDQTVRLWDVTSGRELLVLRGHENWVNSVAISPDGGRLASGSSDQTVRLWDMASGRETAVLRGHQNYVTSVVFSPDGTRLASGSLDHTTFLWDQASGCQIATLRGHELGVTSVAFSPDGKYLASTSDDKTVRIWDVANAREIAVLRGHELPITSVAFFSDGRCLASGSYDKAIRIWETSGKWELASLRGHKDWVTIADFSPDGTRIASASEDNTLRLWDAITGLELAVLCKHEKSDSMAFSPDSKRLASALRDHSVRLWDAVDGRELAVLRGHVDAVTSVVFSADGTLLASGSSDQTVRLWDVTGGRELVVLRGHDDTIWSMAFSPDGRRFASASYDKTVRVWAPSSGQCLEVLQGRRNARRAVGDIASDVPWKRRLTGNGEMVIERTTDGAIAAFFSEALSEIASHTGGRLWAGALANHLQLIQLEGGE